MLSPPASSRFLFLSLSDCLLQTINMLLESIQPLFQRQFGRLWSPCMEVFALSLCGSSGRVGCLATEVVSAVLALASTALALASTVLSSFQDEVHRNPQSAMKPPCSGSSRNLSLRVGSSEVLKSRCNGRAVVRFTGKISEKKLGCSPNWRLIGRCCWDGGTFRTNKYTMGCQNIPDIMLISVWIPNTEGNHGRLVRRSLQFAQNHPVTFIAWDPMLGSCLNTVATHSEGQ